MNSSTSLMVSLSFLALTFLFLLIAWGYYRMGKTIENKSKEVNEAVRNKEALEREFLASNMEIQDHALHFTSMELHDNIGQVISIIRTKLTMAKDPSFSLEQTQTVLSESIEQLGKVLKDIRNIARSVNGELIEELGVVEAIGKELSIVQDLFRMDCKLVYDDSCVFPYLDNMQNVFLFRIVQEAIHNTLQHAKGTKLSVSVVVIDNRVRISIQDNGIGFDPEGNNGGMGLKSMRYRAKLLNAQLEVASVVGNGTIVSIIM